MLAALDSAGGGDHSGNPSSGTADGGFTTASGSGSENAGGGPETCGFMQLLTEQQTAAPQPQLAPGNAAVDLHDLPTEGGCCRAGPHITYWAIMCTVRKHRLREVVMCIRHCGRSHESFLAHMFLTLQYHVLRALVDVVDRTWSGSNPAALATKAKVLAHLADKQVDSLMDVTNLDPAKVIEACQPFQVPETKMRSHVQHAANLLMCGEAV